MHATEGAVEVRRARRRLEDTVTDERVGVFTPDKDGDTADGAGCVPVIAARRGTVCGEVGRVPGFCSTQHPHPLGRGRIAFAVYVLPKTTIKHPKHESPNQKGMKSLMDIIAKLSQEHSVNAREQPLLARVRGARDK